MNSVNSKSRDVSEYFMAVRRDYRNRRDRGISLLETALVLAIFAVAIASFLRFSSENSELIRARAGTGKISEVAEASEIFIRANFQDLLVNAPLSPDALVLPAGRSGFASPIPSGSLQAQGFLPDSYVDVNSFGQNHFLLVQRTETDRIDALVTTVGGREIPDAILGRMVGLLGATGGYVPNNPANGDEGQVIGAFGGWRSLISDWGPIGSRPSAGHVAVLFALNNTNQFADFLFRNDIGVPEANRMNSNLDMNGNEVANVSQISGNSELRVLGGLWSLNNAVLEKNVSVGEDLEVKGSFTAAKNIEAGKDITAESNLISKSDLIVEKTTTTNLLEVKSDASIDGVASIEQIDSRTTNIDTLVIDTSGNHAAESNIRLTDFLPRMVSQYTYHVTNANNLVYKPTCVGGYANARILVNPEAVLKGLNSSPVSNENSIDVRESDATALSDADAVSPATVSVVDHSDSMWKVVWSGNFDSRTARRAVAQTFCFYD